MLKQMLSGTAVALLLVSSPALAQTTDEQAPETEMQDTQTDAMEAPETEASGADADAEDSGAHSQVEGAENVEGSEGDNPADTAQDDSATDTMDSAQDDSATDGGMGPDGMDAAETDTGTDPAAGDTAAADAGSTETFFTEQTEEEILASELMNAEVQNAEEEALGNISDVLITETEGVKGVVIGVGGFLGLGTKNVAVNYDEIEQQRDEYGNVTLVFNATNEELEEAPDFMNLQQKIAETEAEAPAGGTGGTGMGGTAGTAPAPAE